ncbi:histone deacetylase [Nitrosophilus alvini]|uniref:histone deacetylase family protein n=1 Tax=Nitrosophilus alvini TaxID=2714855 RepID=UPI00190A5254|nr:histone deacetylase [Nitrosophilus alvini]
MVGYIYDPIFTLHETGEHIEVPQRVVVINEVLQNFPLQRLPLHKASKEELYKVHTKRYVDWVETAYENGVRFILNSDTVLSEKSYEVACYAAGSTLPVIEAMREGSISRAFLNVRPPGHHAESGQGQGFCIFNNIALMARYAQDAGFEKVMIIDFDVHHGNGTQEIFYSDDTVFYFSTHERDNYPYFTGSEDERGEGRGKGFNLNRPYGAECSDEELLKLYDDLPEWFDFDIVLVSAGYDLMKDEMISTAQITFEGLEKLIEKILRYAGDKPIAFVLEGGYNLSSLARSAEITVERLLNFR